MAWKSWRSNISWAWDPEWPSLCLSAASSTKIPSSGRLEPGRDWRSDRRDLRVSWTQRGIESQGRGHFIRLFFLGGGALLGLYSTWQPSKTKLSPDFCRGELNGPFTSRVWSWDNSIIDILHTLKHYADISIGRRTCSLHCATEKIKDLLWNVKVSQSVWGNGLKLEVICNSPSRPHFAPLWKERTRTHCCEVLTNSRRGPWKPSFVTSELVLMAMYA